MPSKKEPLHVVLVEPDIPQNAGNIARLTAATYTKLHFIEPLGFELTDKYLKRAGLDYWPEVQLTVHASWEAFLQETGAKREQLWFFSTHATKPYSEATFLPGDYLVFGSETRGLSQFYHENYADRRLLIPFENLNVRSFNLANAAAISLYEARRQIASNLSSRLR